MSMWIDASGGEATRASVQDEEIDARERERESSFHLWRSEEGGSSVIDIIVTIDRKF